MPTKDPTKINSYVGLGNFSLYEQDSLLSLVVAKVLGEPQINLFPVAA